jgi:hypothetical protein
VPGRELVGRWSGWHGYAADHKKEQEKKRKEKNPYRGVDLSYFKA